jgi:hypothetical protein
MRPVYGGCHALRIMDDGDWVDSAAGDETGIPGETSGETSGESGAAPARPVTAGGATTWVVVGVIVVLLVGALVLTLTGGSSSTPATAASGGALTNTTTACTPTIEDALDPASVLRLLPNSPAPTYQTNPPTSGPFQVGVVVPAGSTTELTPAQQVGVLAQGGVMIQYKGLSASDVAELTTLAGPGVVVAPNSTLSAPIVATAWRKRQACTSVDTASLKQFITVNSDQGPSAGPNGTGTTTTTFQ